MEKVIRNHYGWDITVKGMKFCDRFWIKKRPNMNFIFQAIQNEVYPLLAINYAEQNNLSPESEQDRKVIEAWTDAKIEIFTADISTLEMKNHIDFPLTLFTSLEERINKIINKIKEEEEEYTPLDWYKALQDDERFNYRVKI